MKGVTSTAGVAALPKLNLFPFPQPQQANNTFLKFLNQVKIFPPHSLPHHAWWCVPFLTKHCHCPLLTWVLVGWGYSRAAPVLQVGCVLNQAQPKSSTNNGSCSEWIPFCCTCSHADREHPGRVVRRGGGRHRKGELFHRCCSLWLNPAPWLSTQDQLWIFPPIPTPRAARDSGSGGWGKEGGEREGRGGDGPVSKKGKGGQKSYPIWGLKKVSGCCSYGGVDWKGGASELVHPLWICPCLCYTTMVNASTKKNTYHISLHATEQEWKRQRSGSSPPFPLCALLVDLKENFWTIWFQGNCRIRFPDIATFFKKLGM